jgi:serine protease AprX
MDRLFRLFLLLMLLTPLTGIQLGQTAQPAVWQSKVDPWVLKTAALGPTEFLVYLKEQADLNPAAQLRTKLEKGTYVYNQLTQTARRAQAPILAALQDLSRSAPGSFEYRSYWVANLIWVRGGSDLVQRLAARNDVAHLYANPHVRLEAPLPAGAPLAPNLPSGIEWNIQKVRAPEAWTHGFTGQGVVIGGADTGYEWTHPALKAKYRGWDGTTANHNYNWFDAIASGGGACGAKSPVPCDDGYHGTHTMGIMVGDDGGGNQIGMAPGARWIGCRNMNVGVGSPETYLACYQWFIAPTDLSNQNPRPDLAPDVINNSWSCSKVPIDEGCDDPNVLLPIVENVRAAGILTAHSAGNSGSSGCGSVDRPAAIYDASFTVGATDSGDFIAGFSSRGPVTIDGSNRLKPDISAPGVNIRSSAPGSVYYQLNGTSMAAPHVAGMVALLISAEPSLAGQVDQIEQIIEQNAVPLTTTQTCGGVPGSQVPNNTFGWGRIDAWAAIHNLERKLELSLAPSELIYNPGQLITYTLQVTYTYPLSPTYNVVISDVVPDETSFINATLPYTLTGNTVTWSFPALNPGQTQSVELVVRVDESANSTIYNQYYSTYSQEIEPVSGPPVPIYRGYYWFLPVIQK